MRPFKSQLLCEQVVGRGLRRSRYDVLNCENVDDIPEEVAKVYGVPFELIPLKTNPKTTEPPPKIHHVKAISPQKDALEIRFPRVEGYNFRVKNRITVDWERVPMSHTMGEDARKYQDIWDILHLVDTASNSYFKIRFFDSIFNKEPISDTLNFLFSLVRISSTKLLNFSLSLVNLTKASKFLLFDIR